MICDGVTITHKAPGQVRWRCSHYVHTDAFLHTRMKATWNVTPTSQFVCADAWGEIPVKLIYQVICAQLSFRHLETESVQWSLFIWCYSRGIEIIGLQSSTFDLFFKPVSLEHLHHKDSRPTVFHSVPQPKCWRCAYLWLCFLICRNDTWSREKY